jgi:hypothetical protein
VVGVVVVPLLLKLGPFFLLRPCSGLLPRLLLLPPFFFLPLLQPPPLLLLLLQVLLLLHLGLLDGLRVSSLLLHELQVHQQRVLTPPSCF